MYNSIDVTRARIEAERMHKTWIEVESCGAAAVVSSLRREWDPRTIEETKLCVAKLINSYRG